MAILKWKIKCGVMLIFSVITYANGLEMVIQNQLLPTSGTVMVSTSATLAKLMQVQKVNSAA